MTNARGPRRRTPEEQQDEALVMGGLLEAEGRAFLLALALDGREIERLRAADHAEDCPVTLVARIQIGETEACDCGYYTAQAKLQAALDLHEEKEARWASG